ncbi:uncharacterized protein N7479_004000, partial [Penicillium vulpinum]|uniref:uncharacterized protein n=1 Tax=Penicillium vulpinum TaxID=29845 RepID=UPI00254989CB
ESPSLARFFSVSEADLLACRIPESSKIPLAAEELSYLEAKGAFLLPSPEMCEELIRCYFEFVHPLLPVVQVTNFLKSYRAGEMASQSLLLLQSMFFAASNFVSLEILARSKYPSIKDLKKDLYQRAKVSTASRPFPNQVAYYLQALYDMDYEKNKISLIQAVLLLGYWYVDSNDRLDSWHWVGVAISLGQSIGLNRRPRALNIPRSQISLWRRLWWCCVYRDRWLAFGLCHPQRIWLEDCDLGMVTLDDVVGQASSAILSEKDEKILTRAVDMAPVFVELAQWSVHLGSVLLCQYRPGEPEDPSKQVDSCEASLTTWYNSLDRKLKLDTVTVLNDPDQTFTLHKHILYIFFQSSISTTALTSITAINFLEGLWTNGLAKEMAQQKLDLSLAVLNEIGDRYWGAHFARAYFKAAFKSSESAIRNVHDQTLSPSRPETQRQLLKNSTAASKEDCIPITNEYDFLANYLTPGHMLHDFDLLFESSTPFGNPG